MGCPQRWREGRRIEIRKQLLRLVETPNENKSPDIEIASMRGIQPVPMFFKRHLCPTKRLRRPAKVARGKRDFSFSNDAPSARHRFLRTEGPCRLSKQLLRP